MMHLLHTRPAKHMLLMLFHISFIQCKGSDDFHERLSMVETIQNASLIGTYICFMWVYTWIWKQLSLYCIGAMRNVFFVWRGGG